MNAHLRPAASLLLALCGCRGDEASGGETPVADLVLIGGVVYTMEPGDAPAEAIAVKDGLVAAVGAAEEIAGWIGAGTRVERLRGRAVFPGFHDAHTHLVWSAAELEDVDLYSATTLDELLEPIAARAAEAPDEPWIRGGGWDASIFEGQLHKGLLDEIEPDRPVYMTSADAHSAWVNSAALALAGVTAQTPDPAGGIIERGEDGEPTGILRESAMDLVARWLPDYSEQQVDTGLEKALQQAASYGITTIIDANVAPWMLDGYRRAEDRGALTLRVYAAAEVYPGLGADQIADVEDLRLSYGTARVQVSAIKLYLDGVIESQTAVMLEPYLDGTNGDPYFEDAELAELMLAAAEADLQIHAHAIGDGAVRQALDAVESVAAAAGPADRRPLIAHAEVIDPDDVPRFAELDAYADFQPLWAYPDAYITELTVPVIGEERAEWLYPIGAILDAGGTVVAGSDWSVTSMNPLLAMEVAVTRQDPRDAEGDVLTPQHQVTVEQALAAYTRDGARATFTEDRLGTLAVGKIADLVVLGQDPFAIDPRALSTVRVDLTVVEGEEVYRAE